MRFHLRVPSEVGSDADLNQWGLGNRAWAHEIPVTPDVIRATLRKG